MARPGEAWRGKARISNHTTRRGEARHGRARHGWAWHGRAGTGLVWFGGAKAKRVMARKNKRPPKVHWVKVIRPAVWKRDNGTCQHYGKQVSLKVCHIDHIQPVSKGGSSNLENLRVLCRRCHTLRACHSHQGMIANALKLGIIPPNWRELVWE